MTEENGGPPPAPSAGGRGGGNLTTLAHVVYGLYVAGFFIGGLSTIVGVIFCYVKRGEAAGTIVESHFTWLIRTFWIGLVGGIAGGLLTLVVVGVFVLIVLAIYMIYRIAKGWMKLLDNQPVPDPEAWF